MAKQVFSDIKVSVILPCRNEKESLRESIKKIKHVLEKHGIRGEIVVSDSSQDGSDKIATREGVKLVKHDKEGYGLAIREGVKYAKGNVIIYADPDGTYDFRSIPQFIKELENSDIVLGSRLNGAIKKGAMPSLHRFLGTPFLNLLLRIFFGIKVSDSQSGFRALKKGAFAKLNLKTKGMEFATEMLIRAKQLNLTIKEIPITYSKRKGVSKLRPYNDGLAHMRYILLQVPLVLYISTGTLFLLVGLVGLLGGEVLHSVFNSASVKILFPFLGIQVLFLGLFSKTYLHVKFGQKNQFLQSFYSVFRLKFAIFLGVLFIVIPVLFKFFGTTEQIFDILLVSTIAGIQIIFNSVVLSELSLQ